MEPSISKVGMKDDADRRELRTGSIGPPSNASRVSLLAQYERVRKLYQLGYLVDFAARLVTLSDLKARSERSSCTDFVLGRRLFPPVHHRAFSTSAGEGSLPLWLDSRIQGRAYVRVQNRYNLSVPSVLLSHL